MAVSEAELEKRLNIYHVVLIALVLVFIIVVLEKFMPTPSYSSDNLLSKLEQHPEIKPYTNYSIQINVLTNQTLSNLRMVQPNIYNDIKPGTYQVTFSYKTDTLIVIYDNQNDKIVRIFHINYL